MESIDTTSPYAPLDKSKDEMRLLHLHSANSQDEQISCSVESVSLQDTPLYEALSYVWGDESDNTFEILLSGRVKEVRTNLFGGLLTLRRQIRKPRALWIDALCINQENVAERGHQVILMKQIFELATCVLAWFHDFHASLPSKWPKFDHFGGRAGVSTMSHVAKFIRVLPNEELSRQSESAETSSQEAYEEALARWMTAGMQKNWIFFNNSCLIRIGVESGHSSNLSCQLRLQFLPEMNPATG